MVAVFRTRIGRIRLKSGGEMRLLPSAKERVAKDVFAELDKAIGWTRELYARDFGGFVLIAFTMTGEHNVFVATKAMHPQLNDLPIWAAEAIRRENSENDARRMLRRTLGAE